MRKGRNSSGGTGGEETGKEEKAPCPLSEEHANYITSKECQPS